MKALAELLETAPRATLTALHQRFVGRKGLLNNARILQEIQDAILAPERIQSWWTQLDEWQQECLRWIYASRDRGMSHSELLVSIPREQQAHLPEFLLDACEKMILFRVSAQANLAYYGFADLALHFPSPLESMPVNASTRWHHHGNQLFWHLLRFTSIVLKGQVQQTAAGELHRRTLTMLDDILLSSKNLNEVAPTDERVLIMQFMAEQGWLAQHEGQILLDSGIWEHLAVHFGRLRSMVLTWWIPRRTGLSVTEFRAQLASWPDTIELGSLIRATWPQSPTIRLPNAQSSSYSWNLLPKTIRELWLLGLLELDVEKNHHTMARLHPDTRAWLEQGSWQSDIAPSPAPRSTANFEAILPVDSPPKYLFTAACIAEPLNDEAFVRVQFSKQGLLSALRAGLPVSWFHDFLSWLKAPSNVQQAFHEWSGIHLGSSLRKATVLHIEDPIRWKELSQFPQFLQHIEEPIPNWGFLVKHDHDTPVRELLAHFGLEPPHDVPTRPHGPLLIATWNRDFAAPAPIQGSPDFDLQPAESRSAIANALAGQSKYNTDFQALDHAQTLKVLRYGMVMEVPIEAVLIDPTLPKAPPQTLTFTVTRINHRRDPYRITAQRSDGNTFEITIDQIQKIRLTSI